MAHKLSVSSRDVYKISSGELRKFKLLSCLNHTQVPLGVLTKNENKREDMLYIIDHFHNYVPCVPYQVSTTDGNGEAVKVERAAFHKILVGGDQLTSARMRS